MASCTYFHSTCQDFGLTMMHSCAAGQLCGAVAPPIYTTCLERFGYKATLIGWSLIVLLLTSISLLCIKPRLPVLAKAPKPTFCDFNFARKPLFWILFVATTAQGLAHYVPSIYIPSYALDVGLSPSKGAFWSTSGFSEIATTSAKEFVDTEAFSGSFVFAARGGGAIAGVFVGLDEGAT